MAENNKPKNDKVKEEDLSRQEVSGMSQEDIISKTISETMKAMAPYLKGSEKETKSLKESGTNIRTRILSEMNNDFTAVVNANKRFMAKLANTPRSEMVTVRIPRVYRRVFGSTLPAAINGDVINIPIDNRPHLVPKVYKPIIEQTLAYEDEKMSTMEESGNSDIAETTQSNLRV